MTNTTPVLTGIRIPTVDQLSGAAAVAAAAGRPILLVQDGDSELWIQRPDTGNYNTVGLSDCTGVPLGDIAADYGLRFLVVADTPEDAQ